MRRPFLCSQWFIQNIRYFGLGVRNPRVRSTSNTKLAVTEKKKKHAHTLMTKWKYVISAKIHILQIWKAKKFDPGGKSNGGTFVILNVALIIK